MTDDERARERERYRRKLLEPGWKERRRAWSNAATRAHRARMTPEQRSAMHRASYERTKQSPAQMERRRRTALAYYHANKRKDHMTPQEIEALRLLSAAIIEAIDSAGPAGAPSGTVYAGLMAHGCTLEQYEQITDGLVKGGMLTRTGHLLHATDNGRTFARGIK